MTRAQFIARYGGIYEHSPWVAEAAWKSGARAAPGPAMRAAVDAAPRARQLALLRAHPDLAGKLGLAALTADSRSEQQGAGLDRLSPEEFAEFSTLNDAYQAKFTFPFIIAVRGLTRDDILAAFRRRIHNTPEQEFAEALAQVHRIAALRLAAL